MSESFLTPMSRLNVQKCMHLDAKVFTEYIHFFKKAILFQRMDFVQKSLTTNVH